MIEIGLNKVVKNYGFENVLDGLDLEIKAGERVALIGPNGCGKTTIFKLISGIENPTSGSIFTRKNATIGVLNQIPPKRDESFTVREILNEGIIDLVKMEEELNEYEASMTNCKDSKLLDKVIKKYSRLQEEFLAKGGYEINSKISKVCGDFKISNEMLDRQFNSLSGGEKTIICLASLVLGNPDILLLDEPTNHLDIETLEWFEQFLLNYNGTVLVVSHDRYFLDKVVNRTLLIERGKIEEFNGNYSYYLEENERRTFIEFQKYKTQQKQIEAMEKAIKQLREWGKQADNPIFFKRAANIEKRLERIERLDKPVEKKELPVDLNINNRSGKDVVVVKSLNIKLGNKLIFNEASFKVRYGEKVALMGKNGSGKTTLIDAIMNKDNILNGEIKVGSNVTIGYIPQEIHFIDNNETILEVCKKDYYGTESSLRTALARFFFYGDDVFKRVGKLSGGEKVRLKLFTLIQQKANLLILDEPTNHIDIDTKEMLEEALNEYKGTLLFISHDRYFVNKLAKRILYIDNYKVNSYIGNYEDYKSQSKGAGK